MKLSFYPYELKLRQVFAVSSYSRTTTPGVQVKIEHDGLIGYGEASMPPYLGETVASVMAFLNQVDLSRFTDPFQLEEILEHINQLAPGNTAAKASVDIALHDLVGKMLDAPWYRIWGFSTDTIPPTSYTLGIDEPELMKKNARKAAENFRLLKIKLGTSADRQIIEAIRAVTSLPMIVDVNQGWKDRYEALDMIYWLNEQNIVMIEQPMPKGQLQDIAWLTQHSPLPIFADESVQGLCDIPRLRDVFTGINIKLMKCTGMREAWKMINLAKALDMKVMIGCMTETSCAISAAAQLAPAADFIDLDGNLLIANDLFDGVKVMDGKLFLNDSPGIGVSFTGTR